MAFRRTPWYLVPRRLLGWRARAASVAVPLGTAGFGLLAGWTVVTQPGVGTRTTLDAQPAPLWLLIGAAAFAAAAVLCYGVAVLTSPPVDDATPPERHRGPEAGGCVETVIVIWPMCLGMLTASLAASDSAFRWRPMWFAIPAFILAPVIWLIYELRKPRGR